MRPRRLFQALLAAAVIAALAFAGSTAAGSAPNAAGKVKCRWVVKIVKGKKKRVRVCHHVKPNPGGGNTKPPPPIVGTHQNPVPVGTEAQVDAGWRLEVLWADPNQTEAILGAPRGDNLPEPLAPGTQYLLASVAVTRVDDEPASFSPYSLDLRAEDGTVYEGTGGACGTLLDALDAFEVPNAQTVAGIVCWKVGSSRISGMQMFYTDPFLGTATYFSLGLF